MQIILFIEKITSKKQKMGPSRALKTAPGKRYEKGAKKKAGPGNPLPASVSAYIFFFG